MKHLLILSILFITHAAFGQDKDILHIREVYNDVNQRIEDCKTAEEDQEPCGFYKSTVVINDNNQPWRAVGNYQKSTSYWHTDDPEMAEMMEVDPATMLSKVTTNIESTYRLYEEYLFEDGQLIFFFYSYSYGDEGKQEYRFYFKDHKLVSFKAKNDSEEEDTYSEEDAQTILDMGKSKITSFINMF
jgi:hypothetical protein